MIDKLVEALRFYADRNHEAMLTGFENGKSIDWAAERKKLEERGFSLACELYDASEFYVENGRTARDTLDAYEKEQEAQPAQALKPISSPKDRPGAIYIDGFGYVDERAVRAIEALHSIK